MEVSALGGIIDTYEKELEEYKKQVFELVKIPHTQGYVACNTHRR